MKKKGFLPALIIFILFILSCTAADKNKSKDLSPAGKAKDKKTSKTTTAKKRSNDKPGKTTSLSNRANEMKMFADQKGYSTKYCFLIDMSLPSGRNRFFTYDLEKRSIAYSGLVAHGSCNERFISQARFSNTNNSGCSSLGRYKVGAFYHGKYGESYRLHGLDNSNSNAMPRGVVIHGYDCVPDEEIYPACPLQ